MVLMVSACGCIDVNFLPWTPYHHQVTHFPINPFSSHCPFHPAPLPPMSCLRLALQNLRKGHVTTAGHGSEGIAHLVVHLRNLRRKWCRRSWKRKQTSHARTHTHFYVHVYINIKKQYNVYISTIQKIIILPTVSMCETNVPQKNPSRIFTYYYLSFEWRICGTCQVVIS